MDVERIVRRSGLVAGALGLLVLIMVLATMSGPKITRVPLPTPTFQAGSATPPPRVAPTLAPRPTGRPQSNDSGGSSVLGTILTVLLGLAVLALVLLVAWYLYRRLSRIRLRLHGVDLETARATTGDEEAEQLRQEREVRSAVQAGIDELDDDATDPRRAVIACWLRLESAAAEAGTGREPGDTPAELVQRMLSARRASGPLLRHLAELYRRARYGPAEIDESMRGDALRILTRLRAELATPRETEQPDQREAP